MPEYTISGIPISFPFEPYDLQKAYMAKVIECLENSSNAVLESPTGTGKTLSLLCSTLAWITVQKLKNNKLKSEITDVERQLMEKGIIEPSENSGFIKVPKIIYATRTHSQIAQAMNELKASNYRHLKAAVVGSRDQLCIHPDVMKESTNANKIHLCKIKVSTRTCSFYHRVEKQKDDPILRNTPVVDIEDLLQFGRKAKCCPYFLSKELIADADIIFMPYNYLLDPKARKANNVTLTNTIVILDEAHNVEKMCEDSASIQIASSEIAVCIEEVTHIMKSMETSVPAFDGNDPSKDFTIEDLALLKEMILKLEKAIDEIELTNLMAGTTFGGSYIFDILSKAEMTSDNFTVINGLLDNLIQWLTLMAESSNTAFRRGGALQKLQDLLIIVFSVQSADYKERVSKCYKVHVEAEQQSPKKVGAVSKDGWIQTKATLKKSTAKVVSYWCFSPGFGMQHLIGKSVRSIILTSGTLAPLKPLISELGIPISVRLENPHIIKSSQICVKIVPMGPDKEPLISNYENRDNPKYIMSLGRTILSFCPIIPHGLLIFFTSYSVLYKCRDTWQASGIWSQIQRHKPIFIEPKTKDDFTNTMTDYYAKINDPCTKGAIFMAVCRGKVSEGLDFADINGRAVFITGLPFPPFKDPRIVLKKRYLQENRSIDNQMLSGDEWYFLEATRAVNQAIGRVIRHRNDYGAILLCDLRFNNQRQKSQLSAWIQGHLNGQKQHTTFGPLIGDVSRFFRTAEKTLPQPVMRSLIPNDMDMKQERMRSIGGGSSSTITSSTYDNNSFENDSSTNNTLIKRLNDVNKKAVKIENANAVFSWDESIYKTAGINSTPTKKPQDFFSRLNNQVKTIDFNNMEQMDESSSLVTVHKRERKSDLFEINSDSSNNTSNITQSPMIKKRKFKIIPNETVVSASAIKTEPDLEINTALPHDRKDLLKILKGSLAPPKYNLFIKSLTDYQKDNNFDALISSFIDIFQEPHFHYLFKGMRRFIKDIHKASFDENIDALCS